MTSKPTYSQLHIVLSPKETPDPKLLLALYESDPNVVNYIISLELGESTTKTEYHIDSFVEFKTPVRQDHYLKRIRTKYKSIPKSEHTNIKAIPNKFIKDPKYSIGYAAKEGRIVSTTYSQSYISESLQFYKDNEEKLQQAIYSSGQGLREAEGRTSCPKPRVTVNTLAKEILEAAQKYYKREEPRTRTELCQDQEYFIDEFFRIRGISDIPFDVFQKLNYEKLGKYIHLGCTIGDGFLTVPLPSPPSPSHLLQTIENGQNLI